MSKTFKFKGIFKEESEDKEKFTDIYLKLLQDPPEEYLISPSYSLNIVDKYGNLIDGGDIFTISVLSPGKFQIIVRQDAPHYCKKWYNYSLN